MLKTKQKRGMIGEQVNWIYVLIAGGIILAFFATIAIRQKSNSEKNLAEEMIKSVDLLTLQQAGMSQLTHFPNIELKTECESEKTSLRTGQSTPIYPNEPVFAPETIKGNDIITTTEEWNMPFRASNFIYMTANDTRYIILHDNSLDSKTLAEQIYKELPTQSNKAIEKNKATDTKSRRTVLIGAGIKPDLPTWAKDAAAIKITTDNKNSIEDGTITFYKKQNSGLTEDGTAEYSGKAMLLAAIYSEDKQSFECGMKKAYKKANSVIAIYSKRAKMLAEQTQKQNCRDKYETTNTIDLLITAITTTDVGKIKTAKQTIIQQNRQALLSSCPTLY